MIRVIDWLLNLPEADRIEVAAHVIEQLRGGDTRAKFLARHYGLVPAAARVLAMLEARAPALVSVPQLGATLWMDCTGEQEESGVNVAMVHLRKALPPGAIVSARGQGHRLTIILDPQPAPEASLDELNARPRQPRPAPDRKRWVYWTDQEDDDLRAMVASGSEIWAIAEEIGRTERGVAGRIRKLGLKTK